ncbi:hypothetical protein T484DRAFT_1957540 [Baffinella frigidus]|nr:hypothetical protein T484DRAFT_1957540 [Cryptophyta sp. CCMP2293]
MNSINKLLNALRGASSQKKSAEEDDSTSALSTSRLRSLEGDSTQARAPANSLTAGDRPRTSDHSTTDQPRALKTPSRSPRSQAAIDKCLAAVEECRVVLEESAADGSSAECLDDDLMQEFARHARHAGQGSAAPTTVANSCEEDMHRWLEHDPNSPAPTSTSPDGWVREKMKDASAEGPTVYRPKVFRKSPYIRRPRPSPEMLLRVEERGC